MKKKENKAVTVLKSIVSLLLSVVLTGTVFVALFNIVLRLTMKEEEIQSFMDVSLGSQAVNLLKLGSGWFLMALLIVIFVLLVMLLVVLNKHYLHKLLFYISLAAGLSGIAGIGLCLFPYGPEKKLGEYVLVKSEMSSELTVKGVISIMNRYLMQYALILLGTGAACLLLYLIIRGILLRLEERRAQKEEALKAKEALQATEAGLSDTGVAAEDNHDDEDK